MKLLAIFIFSFAIFKNLKASEQSEAYRIIISPESFKVLSPSKNPEDSLLKESKVGIILENNSLGPIFGKIENLNGGFREFVRIPSRNTRSVLVDFKKNDQFQFVPLAPAFQKAILKIGMRPYEIPPKK